MLLTSKTPLPMLDMVHPRKAFVKTFIFLLDKYKTYAIINNADGSIAQLGEHLPYKQRVTGSSPVVSTISVVRKGYRQSKPQDTESFLWFFAIYCAFRTICPFSIFFDFNGCFSAIFRKNRS